MLHLQEFAQDYDDEVVESGWLGSPPATEEAIQALEARLRRPLPPSYRAFLMTTNGCAGLGPGASRVLPATRRRSG